MDDPERQYDPFYAELRRMAAGYMKRERANHTLQPTALVNEVFLKLLRSDHPDSADRTAFFAHCSRAMRQALVDHARAHKSQKRGGGWQRVTLHDDVASYSFEPEDLVALDEALRDLGRKDPRCEQLFDMRVFGALSLEEAGAHLGLGKELKGLWSFTRAWITGRLTGHRDE